MDTLFVRVTYIVFGLVVIAVGAHAFFRPDKTRRAIQSRQVVQYTKDAMENPVYIWITWLGGLAALAFGANLIFKAITAP